MLRLLANEKRLLILCHLSAAGEMSVGSLSAVVGLGQSALSQHLARLRAEGLVATRRQSQSIFYRIAEPKVADLIAAMTRIFCADLDRDAP